MDILALFLGMVVVGCLVIEIVSYDEDEHNHKE